MSSEVKSRNEEALESENIGLRRLLAQAGLDAIEHEVAERLQRLMVEELHHRVKNTLTSVMVITTQTLRTAETLDHGRQAIESRLMALGRAHDLLLQTNWASASLANVIASAIEPYNTKDAGRFVVQGAQIQVGSGAVLPMAMLLNELCTNAVKHGALSGAEGHVEITWTIDEGLQRFKLQWAEKGGPMVKEPTRRSFGTRLIDSIAHQLQGNARLRFEPGGLVCEIDIPVASLRALHAK
jgi:two-component sensor histidine kinase